MSASSFGYIVIAAMIGAVVGGIAAVMVQILNK